MLVFRTESIDIECNHNLKCRLICWRIEMPKISLEYNESTFYGIIAGANLGAAIPLLQGSENLLCIVFAAATGAIVGGLTTSLDFNV